VGGRDETTAFDAVLPDPRALRQSDCETEERFLVITAYLLSMHILNGRRLSYANVTATLALVFSMSGGALAANHYLISSTKQISPKVLKKLKGKNGTIGATGATGPQGPAGAAGAQGVQGIQGVRGLPGTGLIASGNSETDHLCKLTEEEIFCYESGTEFTAPANAQCLVTVSAQIVGLEPGKPTTSGPYFRIAIKTNGVNSDDGEHGFYFAGTDSTESTLMERTKLIPVEAGTKYNFGAFYGSPGGEWEGKDAYSEVSYSCFG
jgi:hypothetical protein